MSGYTIKTRYDVIVVGGGPAGLAAALSARENGAKNVLLVERNMSLGGILNQCIHNGFGLHHFKEELSGPEYAGRFIAEVLATDITVLTGAMVLNVRPASPAGGIVSFIHREMGYNECQGAAVVLAMGCRERPRGGIGIPGARPAGVFTAGAAQLYMNMEGFTVGKRVVILGSGDIGLIMARRMTLEGAKVLGVYEVLPYSGGLTRNIVQCLEDYNIPLHLSHTITEIRGDKRVEQVVINKVDEKRAPIPGTEQVLDCDTVLLSVGLIPENELTRKARIEIDPRTNGPVLYENMETSIPGIFACGNVAHVHDLVDFVSAEAQKAGKFAAQGSGQLSVAGGQLSVGSGRYMNSNADNNARTDISDKKLTTDNWQLTTGNRTDIPDKNTGNRQPATGNRQPAPYSLLPKDGVGYLVPHKIRARNVDKAVEVFFRVQAIYKESKIEVESGGAVIASFKREHLAPGEMEKITLPRAVLDKAAGDITVRVNSATRQAGANVTFRSVDEAGKVELVCIVCPKGCRLKVDPKADFAVTGNTCERGEKYGRAELKNPTRTLTSTVRISGAELPRLPVRTNGVIPKDTIFEAMRLLDAVSLAPPVKTGTPVLRDVCGTGVDFIATKTVQNIPDYADSR